MPRRRNTSSQPTTVRRSKRLAGGNMNEEGESSRRRADAENQNQMLNQHIQRQREDIDFDRVSVHTWRSDSTDEERGDQRERDGEPVELELRGNGEQNSGDEQIRTLEAWSQRINEERRAIAEERANLTRLNHEFRMENDRIQNRRLASVARVNEGENRQNVELNTQEGAQNLHGERREAIAEDRYVPRRREMNEEPDGRDQGGRQPRRNNDQVITGNQEEGERVVQRRNNSRNQRIATEEVERHYAEQMRLIHERERLRREVEEQELQEAIRQNNHDNRERRHWQNRNNTNIDEEYDRVQRRAREERHERRRREAALKRPMGENSETTVKILKEIADMKEMMGTQKGKGQLDEALEEAARTPFTREIQSQRIPPKCSLPTLSSIFDGSTCAVQHVKAYMRCMLQWEHHDAVLCKYFASSLTEEALKWFEGLPSESISSFNQLRSTFLAAYITNNTSRLGVEDVFGIKQRAGESLRNLTKRWKTMCSEMAGRVPERYLILSFINALFPTHQLYIKIFRVKGSITMTNLREIQEEYINLEERQNDMESYPIASTNSQAHNGNLLPKMINIVAEASQGAIASSSSQKIVAMGSHDQEELERERNQYNRGGNSKIQRFEPPQESYGGFKQNFKGQKRNFEEIRMPPLNSSIEKIWEAVVIMENIPQPNNYGNEPASGYGSQRFCPYHNFHGHTLTECSNVKRIILKMIDQGRLNHFLIHQIPQQQQTQMMPPPPPPPNKRPDKGKDQESFFIEVGATARNVFCNSIVHSYRTIEDFHDNVLTRVYARDGNGKEIMNIARIEPTKEWQKRDITFSAIEAPGGGIMHDHPLVVKLEIEPRPEEDDDDDVDEIALIAEYKGTNSIAEYGETSSLAEYRRTSSLDGKSGYSQVEMDTDKKKITYALDRILIDTGSSVNILFYNAFKVMKGNDEDLIPSTYTIYGFNGTANKPKGEVSMKIILNGLATDILFCVMDIESPHNALIGRPWLHSIWGIASTFHQCVKFPHPKGIGIIKGDWIEGRKCYETEIEACEERTNKKGAWRNKNKEKQRVEDLMDE